MASNLEKKSEIFIKVKSPSSNDLQTALFVGLDNENRNLFPSSIFNGPAPLLYSHGKSELFTGLKVCHRFEPSQIEGWEHWKACAQREDTKE